jgi:hypothetical protein
MTSSGWTHSDWKTFYDLKVKANIYNLEQGRDLFSNEIPLRAEQMILETYREEIK